MDTALHRKKVNRRNQMLDKARRRHFRNADTATLEAQFTDASLAASDKEIKPPAPPQYDILERGEIVWLTCELIANLTNHEKHARRVETLQVWVALCARQESRRRRPKSTQPSREPMIPPKTSPEDSEEDRHDRFSLVCKPTQCISCLGNERKSYQGRTAEYARPNKMMNEVERHLKDLPRMIQFYVLIPGARLVNWCFHMWRRSKITLQWCTRSCCVRRHFTQFLRPVHSLSTR